MTETKKNSSDQKKETKSNASNTEAVETKKEVKTKTESELKKHLSSEETWRRGFFMMVLATFSCLVILVITGVVVYQFGSMLLTGKLNSFLIRFGNSLSVYVQQVLRYLTYNTEEKPFPFNSWPLS